MDAQVLKSKLTDKNIVEIINKLGGELREDNTEYMIFTSITYDVDANNHKAKLYCYKSNYSFVEYHISMDTFDIFELVKERQRLLGVKYGFVDCMKFVCSAIGVDLNSNEFNISQSEFIRFCPPLASQPLCPWISPGKNTGVQCHSFLPGIFPTQELNPHLLLGRWILYH